MASELSDDDAARWCETNVFHHSISDGDEGYAGCGIGSRRSSWSGTCPGTGVLSGDAASCVPGTIEGLRNSGLTTSAGCDPVVVEKPFGTIGYSS